MDPYIGVSAVMSAADAQAILGMVPEGADRRVMIGTVASLKTLRGQKNNWPGRFPTMADMASIFPEDPRALNLVHYSTDEPETLGDQLVEVWDHGGGNIEGFQLNIPWPDPRAIEVARSARDMRTIVAQISPRSFQQMDDNWQAYADRFVTQYRGLVDHVLIDLSRGRGVPMDPEHTRRLLDLFLEINERLYHNDKMGIGVAGGLCAENLEVVAPLALRFRGLSIDAEGKLRDEQDALDLERVRAYLTRAYDLLDEN